MSLCALKLSSRDIPAKMPPFLTEPPIRTSTCPVWVRYTLHCYHACAYPSQNTLSPVLWLPVYPPASVPGGLRIYGPGIGYLCVWVSSCILKDRHNGISHPTCLSTMCPGRVPIKKWRLSTHLLNPCRPHVCFEQKNMAEVMLCWFWAQSSHGPGASISDLLGCSFLGHIPRNPASLPGAVQATWKRPLS